LAVCLLFVLVSGINALTTSCDLEGFHTDIDQLLPFRADIELLSQQINGETVPASISVTVPNPKHGLFYEEIGPGSSPQALCRIPTLDTSIWINLGFAYITPPASPLNVILWHFYLWEAKDIVRIQPTDPGWDDCLWTPPAEITAPGTFVVPHACVPFMGAHWFPTKMNLFDPATLIPVWGVYNRTVHFYEYASLDALWDHLEGVPNHWEAGTYPLPRWPQVSGWYPASVKIELLDVPSFDRVRMTLYNFQYLWSATDFNNALENRYLDGVNDAEDSCDFTAGSFSVAVQFVTLMFSILFYLF